MFDNRVALPLQYHKIRDFLKSVPHNKITDKCHGCDKRVFN